MHSKRIFIVLAFLLVFNMLPLISATLITKSDMSLNKNMLIYYQFNNNLTLGENYSISYPNISIDSSLVAYYHFDENLSFGENSTNVFDFSQNNNNLTIFPGITNIKSGGMYDSNYYYFNGSDNATMEAFGNFLNPLNGTISIWIKNSTKSGYIFRSNVNVRTYIKYSSGDIVFYKGDPAVSVVAYSTDVDDNNWHNIIATWEQINSTTAKMSLYIDKKLIGTNDFTNFQNASTINIGCFTGTSCYSGDMDDIMLFNKTISQQDVNALYNSYVQTIVDLSGHSNATNVASAVYKNNSGYIGGSFNFNGISSVVTSNLTGIFNFNKINNFTVSAWIKAYHNSYLSGSSVVEKWNSVGSIPFYIRFDNSSGGFKCGRYNGTLTKIAQTPAVIDFTNKYHLVTCVFTNNSISIYVDNILYNQEVDTSIGTTNNTSPLFIGAWKHGSNSDFNGSIDDVIIWNNSLSSREIGNLYDTYFDKYKLNYIGNNINISYFISPDFYATGGLELDTMGTNFLNGIYANISYNNQSYFFKPFNGGLSIWLSNHYYQYYNNYYNNSLYLKLKKINIINNNNSTLVINYTIGDLDNNLSFIVNYTIINKSLNIFILSNSGNESSSLYSFNLGKTDDKYNNILIPKMPDRSDFLSSYKINNIFIGMTTNTSYSYAFMPAHYVTPIIINNIINFGETGSYYLPDQTSNIIFSLMGGNRRGFHEQWILTISNDYLDLYKNTKHALLGNNNHLANYTILSSKESLIFNLTTLNKDYLVFWNLMGMKNLIFNFRGLTTSAQASEHSSAGYPIPISCGGNSAMIDASNILKKYKYLSSIYFTTTDWISSNTYWNETRLATGLDGNYSRAYNSNYLGQMYKPQQYWALQLAIDAGNSLKQLGIDNFYVDVLSSEYGIYDYNILNYANRTYSQLNQTMLYDINYKKDIFKYIQNNLSISTFGEGGSHIFAYIGIPEYFFAHRQLIDQKYTNNFPDVQLKYVLPYSGMVTTRGASNEISRTTKAGVSDQIEFWETSWVYTFTGGSMIWDLQNITQYYYRMHAIQQIQQSLNSANTVITYWNDTTWVGLSDFLSEENNTFTNNLKYMFPYIREIHPNGLNIYINKGNLSHTVEYKNVNYTLYPNMTIAWDANKSFFEYMGKINNVNVSIVESKNYDFIEADGNFTWNLIYGNNNLYAETDFDNNFTTRQYKKIVNLSYINVNNSAKVYYNLGNNYSISVNISNNLLYKVGRLYNNKSIELDDNILGNIENIFNNTMINNLNISIKSLSNAFIYANNGTTVQGSGNINYSISNNSVAWVYNNWSSVINTTLNRNYKSAIKITKNLTLSGTGISTFHNNIKFNNSNQYLIQHSGSQYILNSGASINT